MNQNAAPIASTAATRRNPAIHPTFSLRFWSSVQESGFAFTTLTTALWVYLTSERTLPEVGQGIVPPS